MEKLAIIIGNSINFIIAGLAIVTLGGFVYVLFRLAKLDSDIESEKKGGRKDYVDGGIKKNPDAITWEDTLEHVGVFNSIQLTYSIFEQFVPVFPLLGILGTVAGLIQQLDNVSEMRNALALSMSTTFWGLIAAILLKIIDAVWVSKAINKMGLYFDFYEQNYNMVKDKNNMKNMQ